MNENQKKEIQALTHQFCLRHRSQAQAVAQLKGVSEATVANIRNDKWDSISDEMWRSLGKQVGWSEYESDRLKMVETLAFNTFITYFADSRDYGNMYAIVAPCGYGKTYSAEWFSQHASNVFHLQCQRHWNRKWFLRKILTEMGKRWEGLSITELMDYIIAELLKLQKPLLIFDEAHKLSDENLLFIIELYNELHGKCGLTIQGNDALKVRMQRGLNNSKMGFEDIFSRAGRRYIPAPAANKEEVKQICINNGVTDPSDINEIFNEFDKDLRRVERLIHKKLRMKAKNAA